MAEDDAKDRGQAGRVVGTFAAFGALVVGVGSAFYGLVAADKGKWEAAGLCFIAAAIALGHLANAIWRK
jgi:cyanate permease